MANLNDIQAGLLHAGGPADQNQLHKLLEDKVHRNQASSRMLGWLRESYAATPAAPATSSTRPADKTKPPRLPPAPT